MPGLTAVAAPPLWNQGKPMWIASVFAPDHPEILGRCVVGE